MATRAATSPARPGTPAVPGPRVREGLGETSRHGLVSAELAGAGDGVRMGWHPSRRDRDAAIDPPAVAAANVAQFHLGSPMSLVACSTVRLAGVVVQDTVRLGLSVVPMMPAMDLVDLDRREDRAEAELEAMGAHLVLLGRVADVDGSDLDSPPRRRRAHDQGQGKRHSTGNSDSFPQGSPPVGRWADSNRVAGEGAKAGSRTSRDRRVTQLKREPANKAPR
jgi:hypothetical protein